MKFSSHPAVTAGKRASVGGIADAGNCGGDVGRVCTASEHDGRGVAGCRGVAKGREGKERAATTVSSRFDTNPGAVQQGDVCVGAIRARPPGGGPGTQTGYRSM